MERREEEKADRGKEWRREGGEKDMGGGSGWDDRGEKEERRGIWGKGVGGRRGGERNMGEGGERGGEERESVKKVGR